jgi:hypothetical protein
MIITFGRIAGARKSGYVAKVSGDAAEAAIGAASSSAQRLRGAASKGFMITFA